MKFILSMLIIGILAYLSGLYFAWWTIAVVSFLVCAAIDQSPGRSFLAGFFGIFLLWLLLSLTINAANNSVLSSKIASVLPLGGSVILLVLVTCLVGSLVGGFGALSGAYLRRMLKPYE